MESWDGFNPVTTTRINEAAVGRLIDLMGNSQRLPSWKQEYLLREAITTADFPNLFGFIIERDLLARYSLATPNWRMFAKRGTLPNFNIAEAHKVQGNDGLLAQVAEKAPYPLMTTSNGHYHRQLAKWGGAFDVSFEAIVNDVLGAFSDIPQRFADAALYTEAYLATMAVAQAAGPNALLYGAPIADAADAQNVTNLGALPLSITNLETTIGLMSAQQDSLGRPLGLEGAVLMVPPRLKIRALQILNSAYQMVTTTANVPLPQANVISQLNLQLCVNPLLPIVDTSGNHDFTWYLFADPNVRAAVQVDFLRGQESPEVVMKASDKATTGGALMSPYSGDFASDNIMYRVRHICSAARLDPRATYAQVAAT
jgi:hypothetical protein